MLSAVRREKERESGRGEGGVKGERIPEGGGTSPRACKDDGMKEASCCELARVDLPPLAMT